MFGHEVCVQAHLKGCARYCGVSGQIRIQNWGCGVTVQLRLCGLPCEGCSAFYGLLIEGGCGCRSVCLPDVPVWQGEAAMTYYLGGMTAENLVRREIVLYLNDSCCGRVAEGVFQPCCRREADCAPGWRPEPPCRPIYPSMPQRPRPLPDESIFY